MKVLTVATQKGGAGKTTLALLLAEGFASKRYSTLLIDLDPQGDATFSLKPAIKGIERKNSYDLLTSDTPLDWTTMQADVPSYLLDYIPASPALSQVEAELSGNFDAQYILADKLRGAELQYDLVVIDTPPTLNILTANALTASSGLIVPVQADTYSLKGLTSLVGMVNQIKRHANPLLDLYGIVLNRYNPRTKLSQALTAELNKFAKSIDSHVYDAALRDAVAIRESQNAKEPLYAYAPKAPVTEDARRLLAEIEEDLDNE